MKLASHTHQTLLLLSLAQAPVNRPEWMNVDGFPQTTFQLEQRQLNPFNDVNSFGATSRSNRRPLDTKGELGARPAPAFSSPTDLINVAPVAGEVLIRCNNVMYLRKAPEAAAPMET